MVSTLLCWTIYYSCNRCTRFGLLTWNLITTALSRSCYADIGKYKQFYSWPIWLNFMKESYQVKSPRFSGWHYTLWYHGSDERGTYYLKYWCNESWTTKLKGYLFRLSPHRFNQPLAYYARPSKEVCSLKCYKHSSLSVPTCGNSHFTTVPSPHTAVCKPSRWHAVHQLYL